MSAGTGDTGEKLRRFAGAGGLPTPRDLLLITAEMITGTDTTVGDGTRGDLLADTTVRRDPATGRPMIPAPALAGVLRHRITRLAGSEAAEALFGTTETPAALCPWDAVAVPDSDLPPSRWRIGNAVDPARRTVRPGAVFTDEVVPDGTRFPVLWEVWLPHHEPGRARRVLEALVLAGALLESGRIRLGRRTNAGRGTVRAAYGWSARWFALCTDPTDVADWYTTEYHRVATLTATADPATTLRAALDAARPATAPAHSPWARPLTDPELDEPGVLEITATIRVEESIADTIVPTTMSAGSGTDPAVPLDSGAKMKALLRNTAARALDFIATGVGEPTAPGWDIAVARTAAAAVHRNLFGSQPVAGTAPQPSRVAVSEAPLIGSAPVTLHRTPINPLWRGTIAHRHGTVEEFYGGHRPVTVTVTAATDLERALMTLVLKDLCDGHTPGPGRRRIDPDTVIVTHRRTPDDDSIDATEDGTVEHRWQGWNTMRADPTLAHGVQRLVERIRHG